MFTTNPLPAPSRDSLAGRLTRVARGGWRGAGRLGVGDGRARGGFFASRCGEAGLEKPGIRTANGWTGVANGWRRVANVGAGVANAGSRVAKGGMASANGCAGMGNGDLRPANGGMRAANGVSRMADRRMRMANGCSRMANCGTGPGNASPWSSGDFSIGMTRAARRTGCLCAAQRGSSPCNERQGEGSENSPVLQHWEKGRGSGKSPARDGRSVLSSRAGLCFLPSTIPSDESLRYCRLSPSAFDDPASALPLPLHPSSFILRPFRTSGPVTGPPGGSSRNKRPGT